ncbi:helix-turn-helix transcriptional regulator [Sphingomonas sp. RB56-2]|uniref:Helix-turn-helix transcriptional regulator n=1 Tax=Sphingomonas brevis TaxID=2908206 RepID=A0ABT0SBD5_9SPHN|nr:helix-turn-helix transcriptional regulator [Sphingomonas brevis]MCL6741714.1 helix-turn-helix transcriptional regulator [Sphingomonas brevis]
MADIHQRLATNLRRLRRERKLSQEKLGFEVDLHRTYISEIERGKRNPSISAIEKIAKTLGVSCGQLLD